MPYKEVWGRLSQLCVSEGLSGRSPSVPRSFLALQFQSGEGGGGGHASADLPGGRVTAIAETVADGCVRVILSGSAPCTNTERLGCLV